MTLTTRTKTRMPCPLSLLLDTEVHDCFIWIPSRKWLCPRCGLAGSTLSSYLHLEGTIFDALELMHETAREAATHPPSLRGAALPGRPQVICPVSALIDPKPHPCRLVPASIWVCQHCDLYGHLRALLRLTSELAPRFLQLATRYRDQFLLTQLQ